MAMVRYPGNAHSGEHAFGEDAHRAMEGAADTLLRALGTEAEDVIFTPGASAALWLAVEDIVARTIGRRAHVAATAVEHPALLSALRRAEGEGRLRLTIVDVDETAEPRADALEKALSQGVDLVCTMAANNEVGTISNLVSIGALVRKHGARHLIDASQAAGRIEMSAASTADLVVVSGAKVYGPRRAGALVGELSNHAAKLAHDVFGSPDAPTAVALALAMEIRGAEWQDDERRLAGMRDALQDRLVAAVPDLRVNGALGSRLAGSLHVSTPHLPGEAAVARLWGKVAVSTGAACQSGAPGPSHVLSAMGFPDWVKEGAVRIGVGRFNTEAEIEEAGELISTALGAAKPSRRSA
ncbi:cysteine desulfurase [Salipiger profundus]|nr:cysteine desulfurase [Salipiger profundus]